VSSANTAGDKSAKAPSKHRATQEPKSKGFLAGMKRSLGKKAGSSASATSVSSEQPSGASTPTTRDTDIPTAANDDVGEYTSESASDAEQPAATGVFWPKDLLPRIFPNSRIFSFDYDVDINHFFSSSAQNNVFRHSQDLLTDVANIAPPDGKVGL
jgi:hypothetical protein